MELARLDHGIRVRALLAVVAASGLGIAIMRRYPFPCPYGLRFLLWTPRPYVTDSRLCTILRPAAGERLLEVGAGTGRHGTFSVAERLVPGGSVDAIDVQPRMVESLASIAHKRGVENVAASLGDATQLQFADGTFDGIYMETVFGQLRDPDAALREFRRVLKRGGRIVIGESVLDPYMVIFGSLRAKAEAAGLRVEEVLGPPSIGYYARLAAA
jgi:SAM-dependent methyltransferase